MASAWLLYAALVWSLSFSQCFGLRIAWLVPGPGSSNPIYSDNSIAALKLALKSISRTSSTPNGKNVSVKFFETECNAKAAMMSMIKQRSYNPDVIMGPPCEAGMRTVAKLAAFINIPVFSWFNPSIEFDNSQAYPTLIRMFPSVGIMGETLLHIMRQNEWKEFVLLHDSYPLGSRIKDAVQRAVVDAEGFRIQSTSHISTNMTESSLDYLFNNIKQQTRIIVLACSDTTIRRYMLAADKADMTDGQYTFIQLDYKIFTGLELRRGVLSDRMWRRGDFDDEGARRAFRNLIHIVLDPVYDEDPNFTRVTPQSKYEEFSRIALADVNETKPEWDLPEPKVKSLSGVNPCVSSLFLYDGLLVWSVLTEVLSRTNMDHRSGRLMANLAKDFNSDGTTGYIAFSKNLDRLGKVFILSMNNRGMFKPVQVMKVNKMGDFDVTTLTPIDEMFHWRRSQQYRSLTHPHNATIKSKTTPATATSVTHKHITTRTTKATVNNTSPETTTQAPKQSTHSTAITTKTTTIPITTTSTTQRRTAIMKATTTETPNTTVRQRKLNASFGIKQNIRSPGNSLNSHTKSVLHEEYSGSSAPISRGKNLTLTDFKSLLDSLIRMKGHKASFSRGPQEEDKDSSKHSRSPTQQIVIQTKPTSKRRYSSFVMSESVTRKHSEPQQSVIRRRPVSKQTKSGQSQQSQNSQSPPYVTDYTQNRSRKMPVNIQHDDSDTAKRDVVYIGNHRANIFPVSAMDKPNDVVRIPKIVDKHSTDIQFPNNLPVADLWKFDKRPIDTKAAYSKSLFPSDLLGPASMPKSSEYNTKDEQPFMLTYRVNEAPNVAENAIDISKRQLKTRQPVAKIPFSSLVRERIHSIVPKNWKAKSKTNTRAMTNGSTKLVKTVVETTVPTTTTTTPKISNQTSNKRRTIQEQTKLDPVRLILNRLMRLEEYIKKNMQSTSPKLPAISTGSIQTKASLEIPTATGVRSDPSRAMYEDIVPVKLSTKTKDQTEIPKPPLHNKTNTVDFTNVAKSEKQEKHRPNPTTISAKSHLKRITLANKEIHVLDESGRHRFAIQNGVLLGSKVSPKKQKDGSLVEDNTSNHRAHVQQTFQNAIKQTNQSAKEIRPSTQPVSTTNSVVTAQAVVDTSHFLKPSTTQVFVESADTRNYQISKGRTRKRNIHIVANGPVLNVNQRNATVPRKTPNNKPRSVMKSRNNPIHISDYRNVVKQNGDTKYNEQSSLSKMPVLNKKINSTLLDINLSKRTEQARNRHMNRTLIETLSTKVAEQVTNQITKDVIAASLGGHSESGYAIHVVSNWIPPAVEEGLPNLKMTFHVNKTTLSNKAIGLTDVVTKKATVGENTSQTGIIQTEKIPSIQNASVSKNISNLSSHTPTDKHVEEDSNKSSSDVQPKNKSTGLKISLGPLLSSMGFKLSPSAASRTSMRGMSPPGRRPRMPPMPQMMPPMPNMQSRRGMPPMPMMHPAYAMRPPTGGGGDGGDAEESQKQPSYGPPPMYQQPHSMYHQPMHQRPPMYPQNSRYGPPPAPPWQINGRSYPSYPMMPPMYGGPQMWQGRPRRRSRVAD